MCCNDLTGHCNAYRRCESKKKVTYRHQPVISIGPSFQRQLLVEHSVQLFELVAGGARGDPARRQDERAQDERGSHHRQRRDPGDLD